MCVVKDCRGGLGGRCLNAVLLLCTLRHVVVCERIVMGQIIDVCVLIIIVGTSKRSGSVAGVYFTRFQ